MYISGIKDVMQINSIEKSPSNLEFFVPYVSRFNPLNYNLIAWWDFNSTSNVISDANGISQCNDRSTRGFHMVQGTNTNKPAYVEVNGIWVARFDGTDDWMQCSFGTKFAQPITVFAIWKITGATGDVQFCWDAINLAGRNILYWNPVANQININAGSSIVYDKTVPFNYITNSAIFNGASSVLYENGVSQVTGSVGTNAMDGVMLSKRFSAASGYLKGDIAEVIIVQGLLSATDRSLFEAYLYAKTLQLIG